MNTRQARLCGLLLSPLLLLGLATCVFAVAYVDGTRPDNSGNGLSWATAKKTIQAGVTVAASQPDLTVWVKKNTYTENITLPAGVLVYGGFNGNEAPPYNLSLRVFTPPTIVQPTVLTSPIFTANGGNTIDGFTIQGENGGVQGGAISFAANTGGTVSNDIIQNNTTTNAGAGIFASAASGFPILTITADQFINNTSDSGGAIYANGMTVIVNGATSFLNNTGRLGGAIRVIGGSLGITGGSFSGDKARDTALNPSSWGGAIYDTSALLTVVGATFTNETAQDNFTNGGTAKGGAIAVETSSLAKIDRCRFGSCAATGSVVTTHISSGGAMWFSGSNALITNNFIYRCAARGTGDPQPAFGGGIFFHNPGLPNIRNNTFYGDEVTPNAGLVSDNDRPYGNGSAIFLSGTGPANIINNIITHCRGTAVVNDLTPPLGMSVNFNYNVIWHNAGGDIFGFSFPTLTTNPLTNKDFNIMKDPNLRNVANNDFHILYGSPARDAGYNNGAPGTDIDGEPRPYYSGIAPPPPVAIVDIGADEFVDTGSPHKGGADNDPRGPATNDLTDFDGIFNPFDNCPNTSNPDQADSNGDQMGDACTPLATGLVPRAYFVDGTVASSGDGTTWATAFKTIQEGIDAADSHNQAGWTMNYEVWVRGGGVAGGQFYTENDMVWHGVAVYGAWAGTELPTNTPRPYPFRDVNTNTTSINGNFVNTSVMMAHLPQDRYLTGTTKTTYDALVTVLDTFRPIYGAGELGGGVSVYKDLVNVSTSRIQNNSAALGGGIYMYNTNGIVGDGLYPPGLLLGGTTWIFYNSAAGAATYAGYGGGVYTERGSPTIFANLIEGNTSFFGGGIASRRSAPLITENLIGCAFAGPPSRNNVAAGSGSGNGKGGGIYLDNSSDAAMDKLTIVDNKATGASGQGGGLWFDNSSFTMKNTIVARNIAGSTGGAIFASGVSPVITNPWCYITYSDFPTLAPDANSLPQFTGLPDPTSPPPPSSGCPQTNYTVSPMFVNPSGCAYNLAAGSLLLGAGDPLDGPPTPNVGAFQDVDPPVSIADAKLLGNGTVAEVASGIVTAVFDDCFYIEQPDRASAIKIVTSNSAAKEGQLVSVTGVMSTYGIERIVQNPQISWGLVGSTQIRPVGLTNRGLGGSPVGPYVPNLLAGAGPCNLGLLVTAWGKVAGATSGSTSGFYIDDGSGVRAKVILPSAIAVPADGTLVTVTGISCADVDDVGKWVRAVRVRRSSDLVYP